MLFFGFRYTYIHKPSDSLKKSSIAQTASDSLDPRPDFQRAPLENHIVPRPLPSLRFPPPEHLVDIGRDKIQGRLLAQSALAILVGDAGQEREVPKHPVLLEADGDDNA